MLNLPIKILKTIQIEVAQATIEFAGINTLVAQWDAVARVTSRHLVLIVNAASPDAVASRTVYLRINGDTGANYNMQRLRGAGVAAAAAAATNAIVIYCPEVPGTNYANAYGGGVILVPHAFNTTNHKTVLAYGGGVEELVNVNVARRASVAAITSLLLYPDAGDFAAGSTISLGVIDERYLVEEWESAGVGTAIFDNIPQGEGDLVVIGYAKSTQDAIEDEVLHYINDDGVAGNYPAQELLGRAAVASAASPVNGECAMIPGQTAGINVFGALVVTYSQYIKDNQPHFLSCSGYHSSVGPTAEVRLMSGRRDNIEPINKIELDPTLGVNFAAGSILSLYRVPKRIIERVIVPAGGQATITFANIPQNFEDLILHYYTRSDVGAVTDEIVVTLTPGAGAYDFQELEGAGGAVTAVRNLADQAWGSIPGDNEAADEFGGGTMMFPGYAKGDRYKHCIILDGRQENSVYIKSCVHENIGAITQIELTVPGQNFMAGSVFELEGILRKEGLPPSEGQQVG